MYQTGDFIFQNSLKACVLSKEETDKILLGKFGWLIMDDLADKLLGEFRPHLRDKLLENFPSAQIELGPLEKEAGEKPGWLSNWKARRSWQTPNDFLGKAMSEKLLEKVGFLRVIGKRSAMLTKLALRKPGGSEVRSRFLELLQPICREEASKVFSRLIRTFSRGWLEMQEQELHAAAPVDDNGFVRISSWQKNVRAVKHRLHAAKVASSFLPSHHFNCFVFAYLNLVCVYLNLFFPT